MLGHEGNLLMRRFIPVDVVNQNASVKPGLAEGDCLLPTQGGYVVVEDGIDGGGIPDLGSIRRACGQHHQQH